MFSCEVQSQIQQKLNGELLQTKVLMIFQAINSAASPIIWTIKHTQEIASKYFVTVQECPSAPRVFNSK